MKNYWGSPLAEAEQTFLTEVQQQDAQMVPALQIALMAEFRQWDLYYAYRWRLVGLEREPISEEFEDHAKDEAQHIDVLQRYIMNLGSTPTTNRHQIENLINPTPQDILALQLKWELEAVEIYSDIIAKLHDGSPLKIELENILAKEQEHAHDLQLMLM